MYPVGEHRNRPGLFQAHGVVAFVEPVVMPGPANTRHACWVVQNARTNIHLHRKVTNLGVVAPDFLANPAVFFDRVVRIRAVYPVFGTLPLDPHALQGGTDRVGMNHMIGQSLLMTDLR